MSGVNIELPCEAYTGDEPFAFVSYAHSDAALVYPEIRRLHDMGYRIWYDEGIDPGNEWPEEIANAINRATQFVVFVTAAAIASHNVRKEINYALNLEKSFLAVHLSEITLPPGMALQMSSIQAILKWRMNEELYIKKLERVLPRTLGQLRTDIHSPETKVFAGIEFVWCPPGKFLMGSPENEKDRRNNETQHQVTLTKGYWIGKYPVTQAQWMSVMGSNPSNFKGDGWQPVERVSWDDCQAFIKKLNAKDEGTFNLPTEAEWEYACRAGSVTAYCFGDSESQFGDYGWYVKNSGSETHSVGGKKPNAWGLYDMHGNVWEWCLDWYGGYESGAKIDPISPSSGVYRVLRGGSWPDNPENCRSAARYDFTPDGRSSNFGFRVARTP